MFLFSSFWLILLEVGAYLAMLCGFVLSVHKLCRGVAKTRPAKHHVQ